MKKYIVIDNEMLLSTDNFNVFERVGTEGFTLYNYLLSQQGEKSYCQVNIKMIISFMDRDIKHKKELVYGDSNHKISKLSSRPRILKILRLLRDNKFIDLDDISDKLSYGSNEMITIKVNRFELKNYTKISEELFVDYIHKIGHIGWSLLCILTKLHNSNFGSSTSEGFANPSQEYLKSIIKRSDKVTGGYLKLLESYNLIKIEPQEAIYKGLNKYGSQVYEYIPNHYIVKNRLLKNKYYIPTKKEN